MIEFKRAGDVMVFECPAFRVEVCANAERIKFADTLHDPAGRVTEAFKILDMMIEHKNKRDGNKKATEMNIKINVDTTDAEKAIEHLNNYVWKSESGNNPPGHRFREFMKREGL